LVEKEKAMDVERAIQHVLLQRSQAVSVAALPSLIQPTTLSEATTKATTAVESLLPHHQDNPLEAIDGPSSAHPRDAAQLPPQSSPPAAHRDVIGSHPHTGNNQATYTSSSSSILHAPLLPILKLDRPTDVQLRIDGWKLVDPRFTIEIERKVRHQREERERRAAALAQAKLAATTPTTHEL